jgi:hypothetical protein
MKQRPAGAGAIGTTGAVCGANQPSCGDEFAIMALAASPYDCQAKIVPTPTQKTIKKRAKPAQYSLGERRPHDGPVER